MATVRERAKAALAGAFDTVPVTGRPTSYTRVSARIWGEPEGDGPLRVSPKEVFTSPTPEMPMILPGLLAGSMGLIVGPGGVSKSMLALQTAVSIAVGRDIWGLWQSGSDANVMLLGGRVVYITLEDPIVVLRSRLKAMERSLSVIEQDMVEENLDLLSWLDCRERFAFARRNRAGEIECAPGVERLAEYADGARLTIVDTMNQSLGGLDENSSSDMGGLTWAANRVCTQTGCSMLALHHSGKVATNTYRESGEQSAGDARGSSALSWNARWQLGMRTMSASDSKARAITAEERHLWVEADFTKVNYGSTPPKRCLRRGIDGILDGRVAPPRSAATDSKRKLALGRAMDRE